MMKKSVGLGSVAAAVMLVGLSGCNNAPDEVSGHATAVGPGHDWGDNANCPPEGCPTSTNRSSTPPTFAPIDLSLVHINVGPNGQVSAEHALYPRAECIEAYQGDSRKVHEALLENYETKGSWDPEKGECKPANTGTNFNGWNFRNQTEIFIDVDGLDAKFHEGHPVIFTPFSAGRRGPRLEREKNFSFYNAKAFAHSTQTGEELLRIENYYTELFTNSRGINEWRRISPAPGNGPWKPKLIYSINVYLTSQNSGIVLAVDPDTGNGNDD